MNATKKEVKKKILKLIALAVCILGTMFCCSLYLNYGFGAF